jgi:Group II intron, maturase-specific domain
VNLEVKGRTNAESVVILLFRAKDPGPCETAGDDVRDRLNAALRGWSGYFACRALSDAYEAVNHHVGERVRGVLTRRHKVRGRGYKEFTDQRIYGELGVLRLSRKGKSKTAVGLP